MGETAAGDGSEDTVVINGTDGNDVITLTIEDGALVVNGFAGRIVIDNFDQLDKIRVAGLGGDDVIDASAVAGLGLILEGGDGNDIVLGGSANDSLLGGNGDDVLLGGPGIDIVDGEGGDDIEIQDGFALTNSMTVEDLHLL